jgi:hypothetical protein
VLARLAFRTDRRGLVTAQETKVLEAVVDGQYRLETKVAVHIAKTDEMFVALKALCDERHGLHPGTLRRVADQVEQGRGAWALFKLAVPWLISGATIAISLLFHYT